MAEDGAVLIGALVGAVAGLAGGGFAALSSLRASQIAARQPISVKLHDLFKVFTQRQAAKAGRIAPTSWHAAFELAVNDFSVTQRILCPSARLDLLVTIFYEVTHSDIDLNKESELGGQFIERITRMVSAHSYYLFRWRAHREERAILKEWLVSPGSQLLSVVSRQKIMELAKRRQYWVIIRQKVTETVQRVQFWFTKRSS